MCGVCRARSTGGRTMRCTRYGPCPPLRSGVFLSEYASDVLQPPCSRCGTLQSMCQDWYWLVGSQQVQQS